MQYFLLGLTKMMTVIFSHKHKIYVGESCENLEKNGIGKKPISQKYKQRHVNPDKDILFIFHVVVLIWEI